MPPSPTVTFRLPEKLKAKCEALAAAEGRTLSNWILYHLERIVAAAPSPSKPRRGHRKEK